MTGCKRIVRKAEGQVTVFMTLLFLVVVSLLMAQYRSALFYTCQADAERAACLSVESFLAGYHRPLRDYYQILAVDGGFGQSAFQEEWLEEQLCSVFEENMKSSYGGTGTGAAILEEPIFTFLIDGDWDFFLREITLNRAETAVSSGIEYIMEQWKIKNDEASASLNQKREKAAQAPKEPTESGQQNVENSDREPVTDPRDFVAEIWNQGHSGRRLSGEFCPVREEVPNDRCLFSRSRAKNS